jgi:hypothetical protein
MRRCGEPGCPWKCGTRKTGSCSDRMAARVLATVLWAVLIVTFSAGAWSVSRVILE